MIQLVALTETRRRRSADISNTCNTSDSSNNILFTYCSVATVSDVSPLNITYDSRITITGIRSKIKVKQFYHKQVKIIFQITIKNKELDLACHQWIILFISAVLHALLTHLQLPRSPALLDSILDYYPISCIISEFESTTLVS